jgi:hypothetical protein
MAEVEVPDITELEEKKEKSFTRRVALTTAIFAVVLAITALGANNAMKEMLIAQQEASNQWAYYQAKAIREHLYRMERMRLEREIAELSSRKAVPSESLRGLLKKTLDEENRYAGEKKEIERDARKHEKVRDTNQERDHSFDYAEVLLQIAIVMASISILASSRPVFVFAFTAAVLGAILSANGFFLLFQLPFMH